MKQAVFRLAILFLTFSLGGCLEFERQTLSYHFDKASDSLRLFQDYQGIFGGDAKGDPEKPLTAKEVTQLESVLKGQRTFFFQNWILEFNRAELEEELADLKDPEQPAGKGMPPEGIAKLEKLLQLLLDNVRIENGPFYLDPQKKLCGVQSVTISHVSSVIAAINECAPFLMQEYAMNDDVPPADREAVSRFVKASRRCVELEGNALTVRWPMAQGSYDEVFGTKAGEPAWSAEMKKAGVGMVFADEVVTWKLGKQDDEITRLTLPCSEEVYTSNALDPAGRQHVVRETFDPVAAANEFLLGKGRK